MSATPAPEPAAAVTDATAVASAPLAPVGFPEPFTPVAAAELEPLPAPIGDLWDRIVRGYRIPDLEGPLVEKWERWYAERPDYVARMVERSRRYLYHIVTEVEQRGMPTDVALLPMVESAFNPTALSSARAAGIWQFMPSTGRHYGLDQNFWFDSRRDVIAATDKALDYLEKLHRDFGDWQLALAGYNWGEGNVAKALRANRERGLPTDYESLRMPDETRNYLPKLQAVKNIVRDPERYGLALADIPDTPYFAVVTVDRKMDVRRAAEFAEMPHDEFVALNPQHNRPVIAGANEFTILLPIDKAEVFAAKLELTDQPLVSWQAYRMRDGETLAQVAAKFGMEVETLRAINGIGARSRVHGGHMLLVPAQRPSEAADASLRTAVFTVVPQGRTFYHTVRRGETMATIAARYGVTAGEIRQWNGLAQSSVQTGQQLRVTSDVVKRTSASGKSRRAVAVRGARSVPAVAPKAGAAKNGKPAKAAPQSPPAPAARSAAKAPPPAAAKARGGRPVAGAVVPAR